jgi:hypothetical protein
MSDWKSNFSNQVSNVALTPEALERAFIALDNLSQPTHIQPFVLPPQEYQRTVEFAKRNGIVFISESTWLDMNMCRMILYHRKKIEKRRARRKKGCLIWTESYLLANRKLLYSYGEYSR